MQFPTFSRHTLISIRNLLHPVVVAVAAAVVVVVEVVVNVIEGFGVAVAATEVYEV
jgi:hypothetical protein